MPDASNGPPRVADILDTLNNQVASTDSISIGDILSTLGHRSVGPFLFVPALIIISPLGALPGAPTVLAAIIFLFASQVALGRRCFWVPDLLENRRISARKLRQAIHKLRPVATHMDRWFHGRLTFLAGRNARHVAAALCVLLCLSVPALELVPFAATAPMAAIAVIGVAMMVGDGLVMALGFSLAAFSLGAAGYWLF